ncbi:MAG TPA: TetR/AcrR family transcriptional regulator [Blastocatellia bacterium]
MTKTRVRRRLDPELRRSELLEAAERVLRRKGLQCRIEDVVEEARAAKGTFYVYFPTFEEMLLALRERIFERFDSRFPWPAGKGADLDWWLLVEERIAGFIDFVTELEGLHDVIFHGPVAGRFPIARRSDAASRIQALLRAGKKAGAFDCADPDLTARLIFAAIHSAADAVVEGKDRARVLRVASKLIKNALAPR